VQAALGVSERRACRTLGQPRSTQRRARRVRDDEAALTEAVANVFSWLSSLSIQQHGFSAIKDVGTWSSNSPKRPNQQSRAAERCAVRRQCPNEYGSSQTEGSGAGTIWTSRLSETTSTD
jgi:hypothetical protein